MFNLHKLPVTKKEGKRKGKRTIGPRMKNGRANLCKVHQSKKKHKHTTGK